MSGSGEIETEKIKAAGAEDEVTWFDLALIFFRQILFEIAVGLIREILITLIDLLWNAIAVIEDWTLELQDS